MEDRSTKIKKTRNTKDGERNHICGCGKAYKSYPALYLHIQRKHEGSTPENTVKNETTKNKPTVKPHTGRPPRADNDIDNIPKSQEEFEKAQNDLMLFLGEEVGAIFPMDAKPDFKEVYEDLVQRLSNIDPNIGTFFDTEMDEILKSKPVEIDLNEVNKNYDDNDKVLSAILLWLGRYYIEKSYLADVGVLFFRIREYIQNQDVDFGTEKGFMLIELKENISSLATKLKKEFKSNWGDLYPKTVRLFNEFLKCAFVREN